MIKDLGVVREPRGLSWQSWTTYCKDVVTPSRRKLIIIGLLALAIAGGSLFASESRANLARHHSRPHSSGTQLNLNDKHATQSEVGVATASAPAATSNSAPASSITPAATSRPATSVSSTTCNTAAAQNAQAAYTSGLKQENDYHQGQLSLLSPSNLLPNTTAALGLTTENTRHASILRSLTRALQATLSQNHCTQ